MVTSSEVSLAQDRDAAIIALQRHARDARGAFASNTERAMRSDVLIFTGWCSSNGAADMPASPSTVAAFVDAMAEAKSPATVRRYVSSAAAYHRAAGVMNPCDSDTVRLALKRMHRAKGRAQQQATPLSRGLVDRMLAVPAPGPRGLRNRALLAAAYDTLCRRSELVALTINDLVRSPAGDATVTIRRSKSDQEGRGMERYLAPDALDYLDAWLTVAGIKEGPLFRSVGKAGAIGGALDAGDVARVFKAMAEAAGVPADAVARISGHSSRVGAAQDMVASDKIEMPAIMQAGGWKSAEMVARYSGKLEARRGAARKLAVLQNRG